MELSRLDFLKGTLASIGLGPFGGGRLFAAPPGWAEKTAGKSPNLVFGVVSDTHLCTSPNGGWIDWEWHGEYFAAALRHFRDQNVDAVLHLGDLAHRGQVEELAAHAEIWRKTFPRDLASDGRKVERLFITGNHDRESGNNEPGKEFTSAIYPDEEERKRHILETDMAANWERVWGEKYADVWHREVKGYHFFGRQWGVDEMEAVRLVREFQRKERIAQSGRPFFLLSHQRYYTKPFAKAIRRYPNAVAFHGHNHKSAANWNVIGMTGGIPDVQCPACSARGWSGLIRDAYISTARLEGVADTGKARQGYVVRVYDDMLAIERLEFGRGGKLGADWVMPFGDRTPHPFSREELKKVIGEPQFREGAKLELRQFADWNAFREGAVLATQGLSFGTRFQAKSDMKDAAERIAPADPSIALYIPKADGNPDSRVYAYEIEVSGETKLVKAVYAAGINFGDGNEPNGGVTTLLIREAELPKGETLAFSATPLTSLGTRGRSITAEFRIQTRK